MTADIEGLHVVHSGRTPFVFEVQQDYNYFKVSGDSHDDQQVALTLEIMS
jgi:hypothetical protein